MSTDDTSKEQILLLHDGDLISTVRMLAPARAIRERHRKARITLLCGGEFESLLKYCPYFNEVQSNLDQTSNKNWFDRMKAARASNYDVIYDLGASEASSKLKSAMRFAKTRWVDVAPHAKDEGHPVDRVAERLGAAGLGPTSYPPGGAPPPSAEWVDFVAKQSRTVDPAYFGLQGQYALFVPAGDDVIPALRWPKERWASLAHELISMGIEPAIIGGPSAREVGRYVAHVTPGARDLTGRANLVQLTGLGRHTGFAFGENIGLLHLMVAAGAPSVVFHPGPEAPYNEAPRGPATTVLMHAPTLAQISVPEAVQAMRFAGGFNRDTQAA